MTTPRLELNCLPSMVRNSLETTSVGSLSGPNGPCSPPREPWPLWPSSSAGQIWLWKVMLSLPMK